MVAGADLLFGRSPTGQATPRRSVCAPAAMALLWRRRPIPERTSVMWFASSRPNVTRSGAGRRLALEALESRDVPSTLTVTSAADSGAGALRTEINLAHSGDTIIFAPSLSHQTIALLQGEMRINKNLTIQGLGAS